MRYTVVEYTNLSASGIAYNGRCYFAGMILGTDSTNDPIITIYDNITNSGNEVVPTTTFDASILGLNGVMPSFLVDCKTGMYVELTTGGTCEITVYFRRY